MFIAPSNTSLSTVVNLIRILGMSLAVGILFVFWVTGQGCILLATLLVMAFDIPASSPAAQAIEFRPEPLLIPDPW